MQARSLIWRALPRAGLARHCTSLAVKTEAGAADALLNEALPSPSELAVADHLQSPLAQATIEALKPEGEAVPIVPLDQLEDLDGLYQSLTSPLAPQHRSRLDRHQKLREVDTDPEAFWSTTAPSVESFDHLIRACGMQEQIPRARAYFDEMEFVGLTPATTHPSNHLTLTPTLTPILTLTLTFTLYLTRRLARTQRSLARTRGWGT